MAGIQGRPEYRGGLFKEYGLEEIHCNSSEEVTCCYSTGGWGVKVSKSTKEPTV